MNETTEITTLENGLRVATETMASVQTASVGVWIDVGARYETPEVNGVAHMLEHMAFKGTERRSARQIAEEIEAVGGDINAATSFETTAYFASVLQENMPLAIDVLSDILSKPAFDPAEPQSGQPASDIGSIAFIRIGSACVVHAHRLVWLLFPISARAWLQCDFPHRHPDAFL